MNASTNAPIGPVGPPGETGNIPPEVPPTEQPAAPRTATDRLMDSIDRSLDTDEDDRKTADKFKHPFVRWVIISLLAMLFSLMTIYGVATILRIPIQEPEVLKKFIDALIEIMKMFVP